MKLLILTMDYPRPDGTHARMYVHVRSLFYIKQGVDVTVLNFASDCDYVIDGINVITLKTFSQVPKFYDVAVSHASNIRNHYKFLKKYENKFEHIVFYFHGHEMLYLHKSYPKPYPFKTGNIFRTFFQKCYDYFKINLWKRYYVQLAEKSYYVFVSQYILDEFKKNTKLDVSDLKNHCYIINNSIAEVFEVSQYNPANLYKWDYITIRSNLDASTYCIDLLTELARRNPQKKFLLIGRGKFFQYNEIPDNLEWINKTLNHEEMIYYLNNSKCAINLTRQDTQGVMTCELAAFGIPVITSNLQVCHEFFGGMPNVVLINNDLIDVDINILSEQLIQRLPVEKDKRFFAENTIQKEIELYLKICKGKELK